MKSFLLSALLVGIVSAQSLAGLPTCAYDCVANSIPASCNLDPTCICKASTFIAAVTCCVAKVCDAADQEATITYAKGICAPAGVSLTQTAAVCASTAASNSTSSTSKSVSGAASTSATTSASSSTSSSASSTSSSASSSSAAGSAASSAASSASSSTSSGATSMPASMHLKSHTGTIVGAAMFLWAVLLAVSC